MNFSSRNPQSKSGLSNLAFLGGFSDELEKIALATSNTGAFKPPIIKPRINAISQPTPHTLETNGDLTSQQKSIPPPPVMI